MPRRFILGVSACLLLLPVPGRAQNIITLRADSARRVIAPSSKLAVPVIVDLSAAGGASLAALTTGVTFGTSRLTFDSVRTAGFGSLTSNTTSAGSGSLALSVFDVTGTTTTQTLATMYFTASATTGGTTIAFSPTVAGSAGGTDILALLRSRALDICVAPSGKWGDVNGDSVTTPLGDGNVNIIDAQQIARYSVGLTVSNRPGLVARGDVTNDGAVNIIDAQQIARFSVGLSAAARINTATSTPPAVSTVTIASVLDVSPGVAAGTPINTSSMAIGKLGQVVAVVRDAGSLDVTPCVTLTYASSNAAVASVTSSGQVTALANGTTTITVSNGAVSATVNLVVGTGVGSITTGLRVTINTSIPASHYYLVVDSGSYGRTAVTFHNTAAAGQSRSITVDLPVPAATNYRLRVATADTLATDSIRPNIRAGARARGLNVVAGSLTSVTLNASAITGTITSAPDSVMAGTPIPVAWSISDPSSLLLAPYWCSSVWFSRTAFSADPVSSSATQSQTSCANGPVATSDTTFTFSDVIPPQVDTGRVYLSTATRFAPSATYIPTLWLPSVLRGDAARFVRVKPSATSLRVSLTSPSPVGRFVVAVDTGSGVPVVGTLVGTMMTSGQITLPLAARAGYRVRAMAVDSSGYSNAQYFFTFAKAGGRLTNVTVTGAAITDVSVPLTAVSMVATVPASVFVNQPIPVTGTMVDSSGLVTTCGMRWSLSPLSALLSGTLVSCSLGVETAQATRAVSGTLPAQPLAGTVNARVFGYSAYSLADGRRVEIDVVRTAADFTIPVNAVTTGIRVNVTSPVGASRYYVLVDSGGTVGVASYRFTATGRSQQLTVAAAAGTGYRVRLVVADTASTSPDASPLVGALGVASGVTVAASAITDVNMSPVAPVVTMTAPDSVLATQQATVNTVARFNSNAFGGSCLVYFNQTPATSDGIWANGGLSTAGVRSDTTLTCAPAIPAQGVATTLYWQTRASLNTFAYNGSIISPSIYSPSLQRGQALRTLVTKSVTTSATVQFTSPVGLRRIYAVAMGGGLGVRASDSGAVRALRAAMMRGDQPRAAALMQAAQAADGSVIGVGEVVVQLDGLNLRSGNIVVPLPPGTNYDIRLVAVDSASWRADSTNGWSLVLGASGRATGITVPGSGTVNVPITMVAPTVSVVMPDSVAVGQVASGTITVTDPSDLFAGLTNTCAYVFQSTTPFTRNAGAGSIAGGSWCTSTVPAAGQRRWAVSVTAPSTPGTLYLQLSAETYLRTPQGAYVWLDAFEQNLAIGQALRQLRVVPVTTGLQVNIASSPAASRYFVVVDSGGLTLPIIQKASGTNMVTGALTVSVPAGTNYRVRVIGVDPLSPSPDYSPYVNGGAIATGVAVNAGAVTTVAATLTPYTTTIAGATTSTLARPVSFTWNILDPASLLRFPNGIQCASVWTGVTAWVSDFSAPTNSSLCTATFPTGSSIQYYGYLPPLSVAGTLYHQFSASHYYSNSAVAVNFYVVAPALVRGEALRTVAFSGGSVKTLQVALSHSGRAASAYDVVVSGDSLPDVISATLDGVGLRSGTVNVVVPTAGNYTIRAVAFDSVSASTRLVIAGAQTSVSLASGDVTVPVTLPLTAPTYTPALPASAIVGATIPVQWDVLDPSGLLRQAYCGTVRYSLNAAFTGEFTSTYANACSVSAPAANTTRYVATIPAQTAAGTLNIMLQATNAIRVGIGSYYVRWNSPSFLRGESPLTIAIVQVASVTVAPASPSVAVAATQQMTATARDASNNIIAGLPVTWASATPSVASINSSGLVTGVANGTSLITATVGGVSGTTTVTVSGGISVSSVAVSLGTSALSGNNTTLGTPTVRDPSNNIISAAVIWASSSPLVARVDASGNVQALGAGTTNITATAAGVTGSAALTVTSAPQQYNIVVRPMGTMTTSQLAAFTAAATRWMQVVRGDVPDWFFNNIDLTPCGVPGVTLNETIDDLVIYAKIDSIDGPGAILGSAGPCYIRPGGQPLLGVMRFDIADVANMEANGTFANVVLHEMGHVIGIGSRWGSPGLIGASGTTDPYFNGLYGNYAFPLIGFGAYVGNRVPIENTGGPGTIEVHWRETVFDRELMTGWIEASGVAMPLSALTIGSLIDLGYVTDFSAADVTPLSVRALGALVELSTLIKLQEGPPPIQIVVDTQGRVLRPLLAPPPK